jgi:hypothetical protein
MIIMKKIMMKKLMRKLWKKLLILKKMKRIKAWQRRMVKKSMCLQLQ